MEQRITAIERQEKRQDRRSIFVNGKFVLGVDEAVVADLGLHVGQQIGEDELQQVVHRELVNKAKERALRLLEYRKRSTSEVVQRLRKAGFAEDVIDEVVARLVDIGLLNDADFSQSWVSYRLAAKGMGKSRIMWELRLKGVSSDVAEEALSTVDADTEYQSAIDAARRRWDKDRDPDLRAKRQRLVAYLKRHGFDWDVVNRIVSELPADSQSE